MINSRLNYIKEQISYPQLITFDYGGTLFCENYRGDRYGIKELMKYIKTNPNKITAEQAAEYADRLNAEISEAKKKLSENMFPFEIMSIQYIKSILDYFNITLTINENEAEAIFWEANIDIVPTKNIQVLLKYLAQNNVKTSVISNYPLRSQTMKNRIEKLLPGIKFDFVMSSADYIFKKPSEVMFNTALNRADVSGLNTWHCGDSYECDVVGAANTGIFPVWYTDKENRPDLGINMLKISDWEQMTDVLRNLKNNKY